MNHDCKVHFSLCIIVAKYSLFVEINQTPGRAYLIVLNFRDFAQIRENKFSQNFSKHAVREIMF